MAKVSKYSMLFYSGEQGYQNNRAQVTLADADGNTLAFVRFKDPGMPYELDTETDGIITMHLPSAMLPSISERWEMDLSPGTRISPARLATG